MTIAEKALGCVLLSADDTIMAGSRATNTGRIAQVPVGDGLLGRVVSPLGVPLDNGPPITAARYDPIENPHRGLLNGNWSPNRC
jgi:F-type H+-transporting ATPase subunit alpha